MVFILPLFSTILLGWAAYMMWRGWQKKVEDMGDETARARGRLSWYHQWGWAFVVLAVANLINLNVPFPFPVTGQASLYLSVIMAISGIIFLTLYSQPKVNETLAVASRTNGIVTEVLLMRELGLSEKMVETTLRKMMRSGLILPINQEETMISKLIFVVRGLAFPSPGRRPAANPVQQEAVPGAETETPGSEPEAAAASDEQIRRQYQGIAERGVDAVNQMLLMGSLDLGQSGRPIGNTRRSRRRSTED